MFNILNIRGFLLFHGQLQKPCVFLHRFSFFGYFDFTILFSHLNFYSKNIFLFSQYLIVKVLLQSGLFSLLFIRNHLLPAFLNGNIILISFIFDFVELLEIIQLLLVHLFLLDFM